jgi:hypothetical protein
MEAISVFLRLGRGNLVNEIHDALLSVAGEVVETGKAGSVTVTLKVSHPSGSDRSLVVVDEEVKRTLPKTDPKGAMFFSLDKELYERDPRQAELQTFRVVNEDTGEFRDVSQAESSVREAE